MVAILKLRWRGNSVE